MDSKNIDKFYYDWKANLENVLNGYIYGENSELNRTRFVFSRFKTYVSKFLENKLDETEKIIILPGIRGAGKTTLLAQIYFMEKFLNLRKDGALFLNLRNISNKIYISADKIVFNGFTLNDFFEFYETQIGSRFENLDKKTIILIDEIHYDPQWALFLKLIFDKTKGNKNILIIATGSSALLLNSNIDLKRRSTIERIFPMKFTDYLVLKLGKYPINNLSRDIQQAIFGSQNAQEVYDSLNRLKSSVIKFWSEIPDGDNELINYLEHGSFPFSMGIKNRIQALERIKTIIVSNIIEKDIMLMKEFMSETISKLSNLLYLMAASDEINVEKLSNALKINSRTLAGAIDAFIKTETLFPIMPEGQPYAQIRKSPKYLFLTPNIRLGLLGGVVSPDIKGKMLEDYCALIFAKEFSQSAQFFYDYGKGGADFILKFLDGRKIVMEIGFNKETTEQVRNTSKKVEPNYGIVIGSEKLELADDSVVKIPLIYLMLM